MNVLSVPDGSVAKALQSGPEQTALLGLADPAIEALFWPSERIATQAAWWGHVPFAQWLVTALAPRLLVELGTYAGVSYSAFCSAVQRGGIGTRCIAVDTWEGDVHGGFYDEHIYEEFRRFHDRRFLEFSTLLRGTFDAALAYVGDGTIDLLHIDGLHTYEAVRHDYESWLPKLSDHAVVLLHDTEVREREFGVWRLWAELREQFPSFSFLHGHGLGVLAVGRHAPEPVLRLCELEHGPYAVRLRDRIARLGAWMIAEHRQHALTEEIAELRTAGERRRDDAERERADAAQRLDAVQATAARLERLAETAQQERDAAKHLALTWQERTAEAGRERLQAEQRLAEAEATAQRWQQHADAEERGCLEATRIAAEQQERAVAAELALAVAQQAAAAAVRRPELRLPEELEQLRRERAILMHSAAWRVAAALRALAHGMPRVVRQPLYNAMHRGWSLARLPLRRGWTQRRALRRISDSGLFDAEWYTREYPDVAASGIDPLQHYAVHGTVDRRNPSAGFDAAWYLAAYPDVAASGLNPLLHYVRNGRAEGRLARPVAHSAPTAAAPSDDASSRARERHHHLGLDIAPAPIADVAIGIVTFNSPEHELRRTIRAAEGSLRQAGSRTSGRVFVIDNGAPSTATGDDECLHRLPSRGNIGFGAGHNALMDAAFAEGAELYIAVNPDGLLHPAAVGALVRMVRAAEGRALVEALQFPEEHPKIYDPITFDTPWASGACLAIPRIVHQAIGGFDEGLFMYCEDVDISWRARAAGFAVKLCPRGLFLHHTANRAVSEATRRMYLESGRYLALKWGSAQFAEERTRELTAMGATIKSDHVVQVPLQHRQIADFSRLFHFAPTRW